MKDLGVGLCVRPGREDLLGKTLESALRVIQTPVEVVRHKCT